MNRPNKNNSEVNYKYWVKVGLSYAVIVCSALIGGETGWNYLTGTTGTDLTPIMTVTKTVPGGNRGTPAPINVPRNGGGGSFTNVSNPPMACSASPSAEAKAFSEVGPRMWMPRSNPPVTVDDALLSRTLFAPNAAWNAAISCDPKASASPSKPYEEIMTRWPEKRTQASRIRRCWSNDRALGLTSTSSWARAKSEAAACALAIAASCRAVAICDSYILARALACLAAASEADTLASNPFAVASAFAARSSASDASVLDPVIKALSKSTTMSLARAPKYSAKPSPAIPAMARSIPIFLTLGIHRCVLNRIRGNPECGSRSYFMGKWSASSSITTPATRRAVTKISRYRYQFASDTNVFLAASSRATIKDASEGCTGCPTITDQSKCRADRIWEILTAIFILVVASSLILPLLKRA